MSVQVLMSVMNKDSKSVIKDANLQSDAIIINQADIFDKKVIKHQGKKIQFLTFDERGVGLSRNNALLRAEAEISIMADDDVRYVDGYEEIVSNEFNANPQADIIMFNVPSSNPDRPSANTDRYKRIRRYNSLRFGTYRMAFRTDRIKEKNIFFSLLFGGGAKYSSGEDSIFIYTALKSGLKIYATTAIIGHVTHGESTWFNGYTDKFFSDKGVLFKALSPVFYRVYILRFILRGWKQFPEGKSFIRILKIMLKGEA